LIWGPVGGGGAFSAHANQNSTFFGSLRERLRGFIEFVSLGIKINQIKKYNKNTIIPIARTREAMRGMEKLFPGRKIPVIPEILIPMAGAKICKGAAKVPHFIWAGQNVPRKNLILALKIFEALRHEYFPEAFLDVYGVPPPKFAIQNVRFHGWVPVINWDKYVDNGVLLLTSFREGLPSVVLEALSRGLLCISSDVGALSRLNVETLMILSSSEYGDYSRDTYGQIALRIQQHLNSVEIKLEPVNFSKQLAEYLNAEFSASGQME